MRYDITDKLEPFAPPRAEIERPVLEQYIRKGTLYGLLTGLGLSGLGVGISDANLDSLLCITVGLVTTFLSTITGNALSHDSYDNGLREYNATIEKK